MKLTLNVARVTILQCPGHKDRITLTLDEKDARRIHPPPYWKSFMDADWQMDVTTGRGPEVCRVLDIPTDLIEVIKAERNPSTFSKKR